VLVVEEAHRFAPSGQNVSSSDILRTIASEGRKFGICLFVASQRPNRLDSTVLSQCVTNIVMKIKNPADLASVRESAENATEDVINELPKFERGEALVMGESFPISIRFMVKSERKTKHGGKSVDYRGIWKEGAIIGDSESYEFPDEL
jgi:DNA helicase HerA-like ATPase